MLAPLQSYALTSTRKISIGTHSLTHSPTHSLINRSGQRLFLSKKASSSSDKIRIRLLSDYKEIGKKGEISIVSGTHSLTHSPTYSLT
jgi:hypothetical protein